VTCAGEERAGDRQALTITAGDVELEGELDIPESAIGIVMFVHGSGSSRHSPRNRLVAKGLRRGGLGTLLFDLLTHREEQIDLVTRRLRFDIDLLAERTLGVTDWLLAQPLARDVRIGYFGASTGAAGALLAAAARPWAVGAVVSRGGRPDLAVAALPKVEAPTLLIVGGEDHAVLGMNEDALAHMRPEVEKRLTVVPGATHLFEEPGALDAVMQLTRQWFVTHLAR
jgi:dienelactone hydrolase